jgi:hypothetical protein
MPALQRTVQCVELRPIFLENVQLSMVLSVKHNVELHNAITLYYRYHSPTKIEKNLDPRREDRRE